MVFCPLKSKVIISDRVFSENPDYDPKKLVREVEQFLEAEIIIIPSLKSDLTGHADGIVRFVDKSTVIGNKGDAKNGLEQRIKTVLKENDIYLIDYP